MQGRVPLSRSLSGGPMQGHARLLTVARQSATRTQKASNCCAPCWQAVNLRFYPLIILERMS